MSLPPPYKPLQVVNCLAYMKAKADGRQFHPKRIELLAPENFNQRDLQSAFSDLYSDAYLISGFIIESEVLSGDHSV